MSSKFSLDAQIAKEDTVGMTKIFNKTKKDDELEIMFFNYRQDKNPMTLDSFKKLQNYVRVRAKRDKLKLNIERSLDVSYNKKGTLDSYRISIYGLDNINKYSKISHQYNNHVTFQLLMKKFLEDKSSGLIFIKKVKDMSNIYNVDDFNFRMRLSQEVPVTNKEIKQLEKLNQDDASDVKFRLKNRVSLILHDDKDYMLRIDLTIAQLSRSLNNISEKSKTYELEVEYQTKNGKPQKSHMDKLLKECESLLKLVEQTPHLMRESEKMAVLDNYSSLLGVSHEKNISLAGRQPQTLEIQHITDILPDKYAVTDKADGDRYFLCIFGGRVYLISNNLNVKNTGIILDKKVAEKYNKSVLDGELIYIGKERRHIFMAFDCLFNGGKDIREEQNFMNRLKESDMIVENCFILGKQKGYKIKEYSSKFDANKRAEHFAGEIKNSMRVLNEDMKHEKQYIMVRRKLFINALGGQRNEIYKYSKIMWEKYVFDSTVNCPYTLDGLVYHPLEQKYVVGKQTTYIEYKWKPPHMNSIDFYVEYERSPETGKVLILYDNSDDEKIKNKPYKILNLYVGKRTKGSEIPVLFRKEEGDYRAYVFLKKGEVKDIESNIIQDKTVIECYYNNDDTLNPKFRWVPMRTRYDKTQAVQMYKRRYGNYIDVANKIWRSIINPVLANDFNILADDKMFESHLASISKKITHSLIKSERAENVYYEMQTNMAEAMRNFNNYIKSIMIYTYCSYVYNKGEKLSVLDFACGRGGDIMKFYYARVDYYVGFDYDLNNLTDATNGALSRYRQMRKKNANFPNMYFIHADGGALLDIDEQLKSLGTMTNQNKSMIRKFFNLDEKNRTKFGVINCQFAVHYFLKNELTWNNFTRNINMYLQNNGFVLFTTFDAETVNKEFDKDGKIQIHFTDKKGEKKLLIEVLKKYNDVDFSKPVGVGHTIDVLNASFSTKYITEYLVHKDFFIKELEEKCNLELVESEMFENIYHINKDYFTKVIEEETTAKTKKFLRKVARLYDQTNDENRAGFELMRLNRYYIFRKKPTKKSAQKGGSFTNYLEGKQEERLSNIEYLVGKDYYMRLGFPSDYTFANSIYTLFREQEVIPEKVDLEEFLDTFDIKNFTDSKVTISKIKSLGKKLEVKHEVEGKFETKLNGLNIIVLDEDCDNDVNIQSALISKSSKKINQSPFGLIYKRGGRYFPVIKKKKDISYCLFKGNSKAIKNLLDEE